MTTVITIPDDVSPESAMLIVEQVGQAITDLRRLTRDVVDYRDEIGRCYQDGGCDRCHANLDQAITAMADAIAASA